MQTRAFAPRSSLDTLAASLAASISQLAIADAPLNLEQMRRFYHSLSLSNADLAPFRQFDDTQYRRNRIFIDEHFELLLLCWRPGQRSQIHNHKGSLCGVKVLEGVATETVFVQNPSGQVCPRETREMAAGSLVINGDLDIHQVANLHPSGTDLVTLHLYSPPLKKMELFGLEPQQQRVFHAADCLEYHI
ncbi:cysteine dioxygenase family protein [Chromobacterium sp. ASV23]|uniref:cysteine dioxygenase n=1 Tax=Chromobacterium sp. ASV23 TaxID=2795110 RepID=UPI0018EDC5B9|nr:cysteine dioxygenase family protein [Chromobacterium sp. ASV23]